MSRKNKKDKKLKRIINETIRGDWPVLLIIASMFIISVLIYPHLPDHVPSHWNINGEIDAYSTRAFGAFFAPALTVGCYLLMIVVPLIDPRRDNYQRFTKAYTLLRWSMVVFFLVLYVVMILVALGYSINVGMVVKAMVSVLFLLIGNFMGQFRHNYFVGIKTPWTLASEEVWQRTHRFGAKIWVAGSLICLALSFVDTIWSAGLFFGSIMVMTIVPIVYSYVIFSKLENQK